MIKGLKDSLNIGLILTALFFGGIAISAYFLYRLPHNLMIEYEFDSTFNTVYLTIAITFLFGIGALSQAMKYKKELVVFRERTDEMSQSESAAAENRSTITVDGVKSALSSAANESEILQRGLDAICKQLDAGQGLVYRISEEGNSKFAELQAGFAVSVNENNLQRYNFGEGLIGQAAANGQTLYLDEVPEGYIKIISGLGSASPRYLLITPIKRQTSVLGILEIATFTPLSADQRKFVEQAGELMVDKLTK